MSRPLVPLSNLRAIVILIVVAFHSMLPYLASQPADPFPFNTAPYRWIAFPIIDRERWFGFDLFCAWQDISLMSLMFFLAGLFAPAGLSRKGSLAYLSERWWRIGLPFLLAVWRSARSPLRIISRNSSRSVRGGILATLEGAADVAARAGMVSMATPRSERACCWFPCARAATGPSAGSARRNSRRAAACLLDRPDSAVDFGLCPARDGVHAMGLEVPRSVFSQLSRPLHYVVYFFAACGIGTYGIDRGMLRSDGPLARHAMVGLRSPLRASQSGAS